MTLHLAAIDLDLLAIDPRPCEWCGLTLDRHHTVEGAEGPEHFCISPDEMTLSELEHRADLVRLIEVAEIFARLEAMDDPVPRRMAPRDEPKPCRAPEATVQAFWHVARQGDPAQFKAWLANHPDDAPFLLQLMEAP